MKETYEMKIYPKFEVEVRLSTYCTGCGTVLKVMNIISPRVYDHELNMVGMIKQATETLLNFSCPKCKEIMNQTDYFDPIYPSLGEIKKRSKKKKSTKELLK